MAELLIGSYFELIGTDGLKSAPIDSLSAHENVHVVMLELIVNAAPKNAPTADVRQSGQVTNKQFVFRYDWKCWQVKYQCLWLCISLFSLTNAPIQCDLGDTYAW